VDLVKVDLVKMGLGYVGVLWRRRHTH
jgi:hypothetical protein